MRAVGPEASLYFIAWIFIGNFILLNLFLAMLLDSFSNPNTLEKIDEEKTRRGGIVTFQDEEEPIKKAIKEIAILRVLGTKKRK